MRVLPTNTISRVFGTLTRTKMSKHLIGSYAKWMSINTQEAEKPIEAYHTLNAFFTRKLKDGARLIDPQPNTIVSPVDAQISAFGKCDQDRLYQIKSSTYKLFDLLRDGSMAERFEQGDFITLYLSPRDYHRIHAPMDMVIHSMGYMPGNLLPVNRPAVRWIAGLYTQNERIMLYARTPAGQMALVLVGAHCVGSIRLSFDPFVTNQPGVGPRKLNFHSPIKVSKGEEIGVFEMGSTVLLLFSKNRVRLDMPDLGMHLRMGEKIGTFRARKPEKPSKKKEVEKKGKSTRT